MTRIGLTSLPEEIILHILSFLEPSDITQLQLVSHLFRTIGRDNGFWRSRCFDESSFLDYLNRYRLASASATANGHANRPLKQAAASLRGWADGGAPDGTQSSDGIRPDFTTGIKARERIRIMANWDPSYPSERVNWYDEYIQRNAPITVSWLQCPQMRDGAESAIVEARGMALYRPDNPHEDLHQPQSLFAVAPLDDGSVCLWDISGAHGRKGAIFAKSRPGILFIDGPSADNSKRSKRIDSGVTECVSVDSTMHRAFFAVQSHLIEVDLQRLAVVGCESFPWSITSMSPAHPSVPLTVGTSLGIHLHDYRTRAMTKNSALDFIDDLDQFGAKEFYERGLQRALYDDEPLAPYASLSQPGPLNILHMQRPGAEEDLSDDIYVAGRFSSILYYDRRTFPSIKGTIHSGSRLSSMTSLPYPFSAVDSELRRKGDLSLDQVSKSKSMSGVRTLVTCGEYNTKGSLELYGLSPSTPTSSLPSLPGGLQSSTFKNRYNCSESKLLSVVNHGTKLVFSDGSGQLKWFERDGFTEVRRTRIGHCEREQAPSLFASMPGSDDIARKLLSTRPGRSDANVVNADDLLFWTGEKLGLVEFSSKPGFTADDFEESAKNAEEVEKEREERIYSEKMRRALERQADEVRFVRNLGLRV